MVGDLGQSTCAVLLMFWQTGESRWDRSTIAPNFCALRSDIDWQEQRLGMAGAYICTDILTSSTSGVQLRARLGARTSMVAGGGVRSAR